MTILIKHIRFRAVPASRAALEAAGSRPLRRPRVLSAACDRLLDQFEGRFDHLLCHGASIHEGIRPFGAVAAMQAHNEIALKISRTCQKASSSTRSRISTCQGRSGSGAHRLSIRSTTRSMVVLRARNPRRSLPETFCERGIPWEIQVACNPWLRPRLRARCQPPVPNRPGGSSSPSMVHRPLLPHGFGWSGVHAATP